MTEPANPALYQINTRVWITELSRALGRPATLDDISDQQLDDLAAQGFDWIWLLSVWQTGEAGRAVSRGNAAWRAEFAATLPDLCDADIGGSGFAITGYVVHRDLGGDAALARLRERLRTRGLKLLLDFVPNHTGLDHPWVASHPEFYVAGTLDQLGREPHNFTRLAAGGQEQILAYGRDPYFPGWPDSLQLNYGNPATQQAMIGELLKISRQCDGLRCDMAMLVLPEVFQRTWGINAEPFWPRAIQAVRDQVPGFRFMAEVYWDLEWTLQQQGFDYTYDKRLYDRLREGHARPIREHLAAGLDFQSKLVRFLENHDEPRAAATFPPEVHKAAAIITYLAPGMRFFHQGQFEGRAKRISPHLCRAPAELVSEELLRFYGRLLEVLRRDVVRNGRWTLLGCSAAWEGNWTWDSFLAYDWQSEQGDRLLAVANFSPHQSQCYVRWPDAERFRAETWRLRDQLSETVYCRDGDALESQGLYLDVGPWHQAAYSIAPAR